MSKKRGVSAEEKRARLLDLFYEKKEFFQLKDLEKIAPKEKGIVVGSVKETLQNLVDNGLVDSDKIAGSLYYWAFPSKAINARKRKIEELEQQTSEAKKRLKRAAADEAAASTSEKSEERAKLKKLLENITDLQIERDELLNAVKKYRDNDPRVVKMKRERIKTMRDAANRWTDNIFCVRTWVKNKFNMEESVLNKHFEIPNDLDYIE